MKLTGGTQDAASGCPEVVTEPRGMIWGGSEERRRGGATEVTLTLTA